MMTLMPVAAFAADPVGYLETSDTSSYVFTEDNDLEVDETATIELDMFDRYGNQKAKTTELYVWVTQKGSTTPVDSVEIISATDTNDVATTNIVDIKKCGWN